MALLRECLREFRMKHGDWTLLEGISCSKSTGLDGPLQQHSEEANKETPPKFERQQGREAMLPPDRH